MENQYLHVWNMSSREAVVFFAFVLIYVEFSIDYWGRHLEMQISWPIPVNFHDLYNL